MLMTPYNDSRCKPSLLANQKALASNVNTVLLGVLHMDICGCQL